MQNISGFDAKGKLWVEGYDPGQDGWRCLGGCDDEEAIAAASELAQAGFLVDTFVSPPGKVSYYYRPATATAREVLDAALAG